MPGKEKCRGWSGYLAPRRHEGHSGQGSKVGSKLASITDPIVSVVEMTLLMLLHVCALSQCDRSCELDESSARG